MAPTVSPQADLEKENAEYMGMKPVEGQLPFQSASGQVIMTAHLACSHCGGGALHVHARFTPWPNLIDADLIGICVPCRSFVRGRQRWNIDGHLLTLDRDGNWQSSCVTPYWLGRLRNLWTRLTRSRRNRTEP
jgi:hypothetical protein